MVLLVLAAIWAAVLLPPYLQKRRATHPSSSVVDFHNQLAVLQRTGRPLNDTVIRSSPAAGVYAPRPAAPRMHHNDVMRRRRDVFTTLSAAAVLTFFLALLMGGNVWLLHLLVDAALLGYVALLMQVQQQRRAPVRRSADVRYLAPRHQSATQQALLRRSAN